jgi:LPS-assembly protein
MMRSLIGLLLIPFLALMARPAWSAEPVIANACNNPPLQLPTPATDKKIRFRADQGELDLGQAASFSGNVEITQDKNFIRADQATYLKAEDSLVVSGNVSYFTTSGDKIETDDITLQPNAGTGSTKNARFTLADRGHGQAELISIKSGRLGKMLDVQYSGCPPGHDDWYMSVSELKFDKENDIGIARHAVLRFQEIPIFYWPYFDFPLSGKRKSGVLAPVVGASDRLGTTLGVPYYFNIAANMDDTLTPKWLSKRGLQLLNEFRYLSEHSKGTFNLEYLANDTQANTDRSAANFHHQHNLGSNWQVSADLNWISDSEYLEDFENNLALTSQTHLPERIALEYDGAFFQFFTQAFGYQTVDDAATTDATPYSVLPQIHLQTVPTFKVNEINYGFEADVANFQRDNSVNGNRWHLQAATSYPLQNTYAFFKPTLGFHYWGYDLGSTDDLARDADFVESESRSLAYASLDTGLLFDRVFNEGKSVQTLEPRLFYLYVPYRQQDNLPLFDTSLPDFSFATIFRDNRYVGKDRVGDANQVTVALTSRFLDNQSGSEYFTLSAGVISYLEQQRVSIATEKINETHSDLAGEATIRLPGNWYWRSAVQWDSDNNKARRGNMYLQFQPNQRGILNMGYRLHPDALTIANEQLDFSFMWPVFDRWTLQGRWNYSLTESINLQSNLGIEYRKPCCWAFKIFAGRRLTNDGDQTDSILAQLELSSLANIGSSSFNPLKQSMFYED